MISNTLPSVQITAEQFFSGAKEQCQKIVDGTKKADDQELLISDDDSDEDITLRIDKCQKQSNDADDIFGIGQETTLAPEDMSTLAMEEYENSNIETIGAHANVASVNFDDDNKNLVQQKQDEDLLVKFD